MKVIIENGVTVIKTGDSKGGVKNKHNQTGISIYKYANDRIKYKAQITVQQKKYYLGVRDTVEEAAELRYEAEKQVKAGTFFEWHTDLMAFAPRNKKCNGICEYKKGAYTYYQVKVYHEKKRYYIANCKTHAEAQELVAEAHRQIDTGTFLEWLAEIKKGQG